MDGYDDPHGRGPTDRELAAMNAERSETAHERDREHFRPAYTDVVQVRIAGAGKRTYAYDVPAGLGLLALGSWVRLPGNVVNLDGGFGVVKAYGRQGYDGPLKSIIAVIDEPDELTVRMSVVKTKDKAAEIYDQAVTAGWSAEDLEELIKVGQDRLAAKGIL
jgi:hypothetical protein